MDYEIVMNLKVGQKVKYNNTIVTISSIDDSMTDMYSEDRLITFEELKHFVFATEITILTENELLILL